ncbi:ABC transporter permease [Beijerinckia mobilis]|uniref:ABC transporter permease n=1 Tax=Beijerinckia mobilis TaxID=231434 RepID=UPI000554F8C7|nr:ABC transporter permease [Beijerinckia mobilis]
MPQIPSFSSETLGDAVHFSLAGHWTLEWSNALESAAAELLKKLGQARRAIFDLAGVERLDTAGAWLIDRTLQDLSQRGVATELDHVRPEYDILFREAHFRAFPKFERKGVPILLAPLIEIGKTVVDSGQEALRGMVFLGESITSLAQSFINRHHFRGISLVYQMDMIGFRSAPIIILINFLVGCIVAQQGLFQLRRFGASTFAVDLLGILTLRELGVLLTSIMIAGRSGSAITAEIGSMKMREEIDALKVMGMRPIEVLIVPRLLSLIITLPLLTFLADMAGLAGGLIVSYSYGGIAPVIFLKRLHDAINLHTLYIGLIKAPFMALIIGLIAAVEGFAVEGSAESLGRHVTASVVKAIFMVIVLDGLFAMFFAGINY